MHKNNKKKASFARDQDAHNYESALLTFSNQIDLLKTCYPYPSSGKTLENKMLQLSLFDSNNWKFLKVLYLDNRLLTLYEIDFLSLTHDLVNSLVNNKNDDAKIFFSQLNTEAFLKNLSVLLDNSSFSIDVEFYILEVHGEKLLPLSAKARFIDMLKTCYPHPRTGKTLENQRQQLSLFSPDNWKFLIMLYSNNKPLGHYEINFLSLTYDLVNSLVNNKTDQTKDFFSELNTEAFLKNLAVLLDYSYFSIDIDCYILEVHGEKLLPLSAKARNMQRLIFDVETIKQDVERGVKRKLLQCEESLSEDEEEPLSNDEPLTEEEEEEPLSNDEPLTEEEEEEPLSNDEPLTEEEEEEPLSNDEPLTEEEEEELLSNDEPLTEEEEEELLSNDESLTEEEEEELLSNDESLAEEEEEESLSNDESLAEEEEEELLSNDESLTKEEEEQQFCNDETILAPGCDSTDEMPEKKSEKEDVCSIEILNECLIDALVGKGIFSQPTGSGWDYSGGDFLSRSPTPTFEGGDFLPRSPTPIFEEGDFLSRSPTPIFEEGDFLSRSPTSTFEGDDFLFRSPTLTFRGGAEE